jgi:O-antigen ligase
VGDKGRVSGPLGSPIIFGSLIPILFFNIYVAVKSQLLPRYLLWLSGGLSTILIILTFTRSVWLGAFLAFVVVFLIVDDDDKSVKLLRVGGFVAAAILLLAVLTFTSPDIEKRLTGEENANFRVVMAEASVDMILDKPFLGWGSGTFDDIVDRYLFDARGVYIVKDTSHVTLLTLLAEVGIVGTSFFLGFIVLALRRRGLRLNDLSAFDRLIVAANVGGLICITINAFLIDMRYYAIAYAWFFINLGFIHNIYRQHFLATKDIS